MKAGNDKAVAIWAELPLMMVLAGGFCLGMAEGMSGDWFGYVFAAIDFCAGGLIGVIIWAIAVR